jgi:hypothetical protein
MRLNSIKHTILTIVVATTLFNASCGTILYPERRGQPAGKIDAGVAVLDGIGLIFFLVPGVIAFAVDFATGAIYLPPEKPLEKTNAQADSPDFTDMVVIQLDRQELTPARIQTAIAERTGKVIDLTSPSVIATRIEGRGVGIGGLPVQ